MKLDHLVILVADLQRSLLFYDTLLPLLGFRKLREHVYANEDAIHLDITQASDRDHSYHRFAPGLNHIGLTAPSLQALERTATAMREAALEVPAIQQFDNRSAIFFKDPDGMRIEVSTNG